MWWAIGGLLALGAVALWLLAREVIRELNEQQRLDEESEL